MKLLISQDLQPIKLTTGVDPIAVEDIHEPLGLAKRQEPSKLISNNF